MLNAQVQLDSDFAKVLDTVAQGVKHLLQTLTLGQKFVRSIVVNLFGYDKKEELVCLLRTGWCKVVGAECSIA